MASSVIADERNRRTIYTAACLIIGDEILGGKVVDTNSAYMARFCFSLGIILKRIEVIGDDEAEIIEAVKRLSDEYDFVVTSGGIGPTHDDITYPSIAKAFGLPLNLHMEAYERMKRLSKPQLNFSWDEDSPIRRAKLRMVELPTDETRDPNLQFLFPADDLWVPVVVVNGNLHILPGMPNVFRQLLDSLKPVLLPRLADHGGKGIHRITISTPMGESAIASYLTELANELEPEGIKVGSYPAWGKLQNSVTLVGRNVDFMESLVAGVEKSIGGHRIFTDGVDDGQQILP